MKKVFQLAGTAFKFLHPTKVEAAYHGGILTDEAWAKYQDGRKQYLLKHLTLCKNNKMMICKVCEGKYFITANEPGACGAGKDDDAHIPAYDFSISENVLECAI